VPTGPMPPINVPGLIRVEMHFLLNGERTENVFHCMNNVGSPGDIQLHLVANTFKNWWMTEMRGHVANNLILQDVTARELTPTGVAVLETEDLPAGGTVGGGNALPGNITLAVHWGTGLRGRSFNGRTYHMGFNRDQVNGNVVDATVGAALLTAYNALRTALDNVLVGVEFGVLSVQHAKAWRTPPIITPITGVAIDPNMDSQRRRLKGRGQ
jgi:hypothetical protein